MQEEGHVWACLLCAAAIKRGTFVAVAKARYAHITAAHPGIDRRSCGDRRTKALPTCTASKLLPMEGRTRACGYCGAGIGDVPYSERREAAKKHMESEHPAASLAEAYSLRKTDEEMQRRGVKHMREAYRKKKARCEKQMGEHCATLVPLDCVATGGRVNASFWTCRACRRIVGPCHFAKTPCHSMAPHDELGDLRRDLLRRIKQNNGNLEQLCEAWLLTNAQRKEDMQFVKAEVEDGGEEGESASQAEEET